MAKIYKRTYYKTNPKTGEKNKMETKKWWADTSTPSVLNDLRRWP